MDGIIAPLFFFILGGPMGAILYRTANTMDSMLGYKIKVLIFGRVAARFDDALNWLPARITFILFVISAFILRFDAKKQYKLACVMQKNILVQMEAMLKHRLQELYISV